MIDVMDKHFQEVLHLSKSQSAWVQFAHYLGYFLMSLPAGWLAIKLGYKGGIIAGLLIVAVGGFWFIPATRIAAFWAFLLGVCMIASGLTFLETVCNPYTTVLGDPAVCRYAHQPGAVVQRHRVDLRADHRQHVFLLQGRRRKQHGEPDALYSLRGGGVRGDCTGRDLLFRQRARYQDGRRLPSGRRRARAGRRRAGAVSQSIWQHPHFVLAVAAQFLYVAAQAGIFSFFINYMTAEVPPIPASWSAAVTRAATHAGLLEDWLKGWFETGPTGAIALSSKGASNMAALALVCFLIGRFTGAGLLKKYSAHKILGIYGGLNVAMTLAVFLKLGWFSVICVFLSYFFMSIMFPTIFALGIFGLGARAKKASAFIVMAIMGGAILPKLMGLVADKFDMSRGFIVPMFCFAFVAFYGFNWPKFSNAESLDSVHVAGGGR